MKKEYNNYIETANTKGNEMNETIKQIAKCMGIETLETRHSDDMDFHDLAVWNIKKALEAAYKAGKEAKK